MVGSIFHPQGFQAKVEEDCAVCKCGNIVATSISCVGFMVENRVEKKCYEMVTKKITTVSKTHFVYFGLISISCQRTGNSKVFNARERLGNVSLIQEKLIF